MEDIQLKAPPTRPNIHLKYEYEPEEKLYLIHIIKDNILIATETSKKQPYANTTLRSKLEKTTGLEQNQIFEMLHEKKDYLIGLKQQHNPTEEINDELTSHSIDWTAKQKPINPALDYNEGIYFISQYLPVEQENSTSNVCSVIRSDGLMEFITPTSETTFSPISIPAAIENRWSIKSIQQFTEDKAPKISLEDMHKEIRAELEYYMDFTDPRYYDLMALWTIGTYLHPMFTTYPYVFLNAVKQSGKTKLLTLISCLAFNAKAALSLTPASLFRLIQSNRCTLLIDENEKLNGGKDENDFRSLLLAGYKKGMKVPRVSERKIDGVTTRSVEEFDLYSPKMLANITGIEDVLEDRCITLIIKRTRNLEKGNREIEITDPKWQEIRDRLYLFTMQFVNECTVNNVSPSTKSPNDTHIFNNPIKNIYIKKQGDLTYNGANGNMVTSDFEISNRDLELWKPILTLSGLISEDLYGSMYRLAVEKSKEKRTENITETYDLLLATVLVNFVTDKGYYKVSEIKDEFNAVTESDPMSAKWVGKALKRLDVILHKKHMGRKGRQVLLDPLKCQDMAERLGVDLHELDIVPPKQKSLVPEPENKGIVDVVLMALGEHDQLSEEDLVLLAQGKTENLFTPENLKELLAKLSRDSKIVEVSPGIWRNSN